MSGAPYDPTTRRDTPLAIKLKHRIARDGPICVADYMRACLWDEEHGYYATHQVVGAMGDFITAPEISQVFGELIGLWAAVAWAQVLGAPPQVSLAEFGPGRGTMMRDALRAARLVKDFSEAVSVHLIEASETLQAAQRATLSDVAQPVSWGTELDGIPTPAIILANEFLDALPIAQWIKTADGWRERSVGLDDTGELCFGVSGHFPLSPSSPFDERGGGRVEVMPGSDPKDDNNYEPRKEPGHQFEDAPFGSVTESLRPEFVVDALKALARSGPVVALFIDYGHDVSSIGETLQAVRNHKFESPLTSPGEADLSSHVDFAAFARACHAAGLETDGPTTQAEFLGRLGIIERASKLMYANPAKAGEIESAIARLMAPGGMGGRFKVIGIRSAGLPMLPGF